VATVLYELIANNKNKMRRPFTFPTKTLRWWKSCIEHVRHAPSSWCCVPEVQNSEVITLIKFLQKDIIYCTCNLNVKQVMSLTQVAFF
jgi:hypothetical protein